jgi:hypothetical protein
MKNCKLCRLDKVCNDLPGICILFQYLAVVLVIATLGFLFITQEILVPSRLYPINTQIRRLAPFSGASPASSRKPEDQSLR